MTMMISTKISTMIILIVTTIVANNSSGNEDINDIGNSNVVSMVITY